MKVRKNFIFFTLLILLIAGTVLAIDKNNITVTNLENNQVTDIRIRPNLSAAETCEVRHDLGRYWQIGNWVVGNELYKSYLDPSLTCANPYPYSVTEISMLIKFDSATSITVSVDVENADYSNPACPFPDTIMVGISSTWSYTIPEAGVYNIIVPFDAPIVVHEPFFAGFFIGDIDTTHMPFLFTDSNTQSICVSYNVWDDSIGFVDLMGYDFPGQLILYANGVPGGGPSEPEPAVTILSPYNNETKYRSTEIWANEISGSSIIDYVSFAYFTNADTTEIGRVYDGTKTFRDGINPSSNAKGYSIDWDFSTLSEGTYNILVTAVDSLGRTASEQIALFLEPSPPIAEIASPSYDANFCPQFDILMSSNDDNLTNVKLSYQKSEPNFSISAKTLLLSDFGNHFSSAISASLAIQALDDRSIYDLMREKSAVVDATQMTNIMATYFSINANNGVYDENVFEGLQLFNASIHNVLDIGYIRSPNYLDLRTEIELNQKVAIAGIGGTSNNWILIDGFSGTKNLDGTYNITISNPVTALIETVQLRNQGLGVEIFYNGGWQPIEIIFHIGTDGWSSTQTPFGEDINRADGWSFNWTPPNLWHGYDYFIQSEGIDLTGLKGYDVTMYAYDCTQFYLAGDFNNDGYANITDLNYLISYFINQGAPPVGGDGRADTNCDGYLNITDIVYYANFIFGQAPTPCY